MSDSTKIDDGGPASGWPANGWMQGNTGLSIRDWFAAMAMAGIAERPGQGCIGYIEQRATIAYQVADAMIEARKK